MLLVLLLTACDDAVGLLGAAACLQIAHPDGTPDLDAGDTAFLQGAASRCETHARELEWDIENPETLGGAARAIASDGDITPTEHDAFLAPKVERRR